MFVPLSHTNSLISRPDSPWAERRLVSFCSVVRGGLAQSQNRGTGEAIYGPKKTAGVGNRPPRKKKIMWFGLIAELIMNDAVHHMRAFHALVPRSMDELEARPMFCRGPPPGVHISHGAPTRAT